MKRGGVPLLGQEFRAGDLLGRTRHPPFEQLTSKAQPPTFRLPSPPLIGFNKQFNNTTLLDQIKLLLRLIPGQSFEMPASSRIQLLAEHLQIWCRLPNIFPLS